MQETDRRPRPEEHSWIRRMIRFTGRVVLAGVVICGVTSLIQKVLWLRATNRVLAQETDSLQQQFEGAQEQLRNLQEERKFLGTRAGILAEARRLGYGRPGEVRLIMVPKEEAPPRPR